MNMSHLKPWFFFLYLLFQFFVAFVPGQYTPSPPFPHFDKVIHFGTYFVFNSLLCFYLRSGMKQPKINEYAIFLSIISTFIYALIEETIQNFIPGRTSDFFDLHFDFLGTLLGAAFFKLINQKSSSISLKSK